MVTFVLHAWETLLSTITVLGVFPFTGAALGEGRAHTTSYQMQYEYRVCKHLRTRGGDFKCERNRGKEEKNDQVFEIVRATNIKKRTRYKCKICLELLGDAQKYLNIQCTP